jgi:dihydropyrimidinase
VRLLIRNGRIITATDDYFADVLCDRGRIVAIGRDLDVANARIIDAGGRWVIPGGVDPHTHFDMPFGGTFSADDFESGTIAAAFGGTTTIIDFAVQQHGQSMLAALDTWHQKAHAKAVIDYGFHMIVTDMPDGRTKELSQLADAGVTSYKLFMAYPGVLYSDDAQIFRAMRQAGQDGTMVCMHAENGIVIEELIKQALQAGHTAPRYHALTRPTRMEGEGVYRALAIAEVAQVPVYIVHLSSADALEEVRRGRDRGVDAYAETCPQYLFLDETAYDAPGFEGAKYVMTPPLRHHANQAHLWRGLRLGDLHAVATDHCPFCFSGQKELGLNNFANIPNGAPGVESRLALLYEGGVKQGRLSPNQFVQFTSTAAAKLFGLFPRKGTIAPGSDADIVIFNPNRAERISVDNPRTHHMRVDYNTFEGFQVSGYPDVVIAGGEVIVENHEFKGRPGAGRFLKRARYNGLLRD